jgi:hypothetical protein
MQQQQQQQPIVSKGESINYSDLLDIGDDWPVSPTTLNSNSVQEIHNYDHLFVNNNSNNNSNLVDYIATLLH